MGRRGDDFGANPLTRPQRLISTGISVVVGIIVMAITEQLLWGLVTFMVLGVLLNGAILYRSRR